MSGRRLAVALLLAIAVPLRPATAQQSATATPEPDTVSAEAPVSSIDTSELEAGDDDGKPPKRHLIHWNEIDGPVTTFRVGLGLLLDAATYDQDDDSERQVGEMDANVGFRDSRLLFRGKAKTKRPLTWTLGYMYDSADHSWRFRQTGVQIGFPEAHGNLFIGRTKEGYSLIKVMTGYHPWTMERSPGLDAFVPILADGLKWMGYFPEHRVFFSLGVFGDELSEEETFSTYDHQVVTRIGWLPIVSADQKALLHLAVMGRDGRPDEGSIRFKSKPEESLSPIFVDTGKFASDHAQTLGAEAYYRDGSWLCGGEYDRQEADATAGGTAVFHAADAVVAWLVTGEIRGYNARGGFFEAISPNRTVFDGGPGAWELVFHASWIDLDDGTFQGGKLWRLTPMVNWHLSDHLRLELGYGYAELDRFGVEGHTQFLQSRLQFAL